MNEFIELRSETMMTQFSYAIDLWEMAYVSGKILFFLKIKHNLIEFTYTSM